MHWKPFFALIAVMALACFAGGSLTSWMISPKEVEAQRPRNITAESVSVIDSSGNTRALIRYDGNESGLWIFDVNGVNRAGFTYWEDGDKTGIWCRNKKARIMAKLIADGGDDMSGLFINDTAGNTRVAVSYKAHLDEGGVFVYDAQRNQRAEFSHYGKGFVSGIWLRDRNGEVQWSETVD